MSEQTTNNKRNSINSVNIVVGLFIFLLLFWFVQQIISPPPPSLFGDRVVCGSHLSSLGKKLMIYASDNNDLYPDADKWCDLLLKWTDIDKKVLLCPADKVGPCDYAMNPNCRTPLASSDLVLLFETKPVWNQSGGPELLRDNHKGGSNILFNDSSVRWIDAKDFNSLKWK